MRLRRYTLIWLLAFFEISSASGLGLVLDWADFRGDSRGNAWLEIYSRFNRQDFVFRFDSSSSAYVGTLYFVIEIRNAADELVDSLSYRLPMFIPANEPISAQFKILNTYQFDLPVDDYSIFCTACDPVGDLCDTVVLDISLTDYTKDEDGASAIMLAYTAVPDSTENAFVRMGAKMFPNPSAIFDLNSLVVYYYAEFYLSQIEPIRVHIRPQIISEDTVFRAFETGWRVFKSASAYIGGFSIAGFPDGDFALLLEMTDSTGNTLASTKKKFSVIKKPENIIQIATPELGDEMRNILYYLLKPDELRLFDELPPQNKLLFWKKFWADRDPVPETPGNEYMQQYMARWNHVNKVFTHGNTEGWRTDQGRIYIIYGAPDQIERNSVGLATNPWEIWSYFEKNYFFIFADLLSLGKMELVHSNVEGETQDEFWKERLFKGHDRLYYERFDDTR